MKRTGLNFDSVHASDPAFRSLVQEYGAIVAHYVARFESPRDAMKVMLQDSAHVAPQDVAGKLDSVFDESQRTARVINDEACVVRNQLLIGVVKRLGADTPTDRRDAQRFVRSLIEEFRDVYGCLPSAVESVLRYEVREQKEERLSGGGTRFSGVLYDRGPNPEPLVHAYIWLERIALPVLAASLAPDRFFTSIAPRHFSGNFDPRRPFFTIPTWGTIAFQFNAELRNAWLALSDAGRISIIEEAPRRAKPDGRRAAVWVHKARSDFYAEELQKQRDELRKLRRRPFRRAPASTGRNRRRGTDAVVAAVSNAGKRFDIGPDALHESRRLASLHESKESTPLDWLDFLDG